MANVFKPGPWERELGPARGTRLGPDAGARELGLTLYEVDPEGQAAPYHLHYANEELLIVIEGELELRTPVGTRTLEAGDVVGFPVGPDGAHRVRNRGEGRARYIVISTQRFPEIAEQLDTRTVLPMTAPGEGWAFPDGTAGDYMALTLAALEADEG